MMGRRHCLSIAAALNALLGVLASSSTSCLPLLMISIFSILSPSANEIGPIVAIELAGLSQVISKANVTKYISWYKLFGSLTSGIAMVFNGILFPCIQSYLSRHQLYVVIMLSYSVCQLFLAGWCLQISPDFDAVVNHRVIAKELDPLKSYNKLSDSSKQSILHVLGFYLTDSYASSYITLLLITLYLQSNFNFQPLALSILSALLLILAGLSDTCDDTICSYFGLVQSVVVFQFPANIILIIFPYIPYSYITVIILLLRYSISQFDSPIRNAYVNMVITPSDRSGVNTVVNMVRVVAIVLAPYILYTLSYFNLSFSLAVVLSGWLKIAYDVLLMRDFMVANDSKNVTTFDHHPSPSSPLNQPHSPMRVQ